MKPKLILSMIALVVIPTAILSLLAGRSVRLRELEIERRLDAASRQAVASVTESFQATVTRAHSDVVSTMSELLSSGQVDGILPASQQLRAKHDLIDHVYIIRRPTTYIYPTVPPVDTSDLAATNIDLSPLATAIALHQRKQYDRAAREYRQAVEKPGQVPSVRAEAVLGAGVCYTMLGQFDFAADVFRQGAGYSTGPLAARKLALNPQSALRDAAGRIYSMAALRGIVEAYAGARDQSDRPTERQRRLAIDAELELLDRFVYLYDHIVPMQRAELSRTLGLNETSTTTSWTTADGDGEGWEETAWRKQAGLHALLRERAHGLHLTADHKAALALAIRDAIAAPQTSKDKAWIATPPGASSFALMPGSTNTVVGFTVDAEAVAAYLDTLAVEIGAKLGVTIAQVDNPAGLSEASRANGRLPWPFNDVLLSARPARSEALRHERALKVRLQEWGIGVLALGVIAGVVLILRQATAELRHARAKSDFMAGISHDLRTPLASMTMLAESLHMGRIKDPAQQKEFLATILKESDRLGHLVERVLFFVRLGEDALTYQMQSTDIGALVKEFEEPGVTVTVEPGLPLGNVDAEAINQVVRNLVDNAVKYAKGKELTVNVTRNDPGHIAISVQDHGIGIDPADLKRIFQRFYRTKRAADSVASGIGLGLTLCQHIVRAHGGTIEVESEQDKGSTFTVLLPVNH